MQSSEPIFSIRQTKAMWCKPHKVLLTRTLLLDLIGLQQTEEAAELLVQPLQWSDPSSKKYGLCLSKDLQSLYFKADRGWN
jgi:hypothetical protein